MYQVIIVRKVEETSQEDTVTRLQLSANDINSGPFTETQLRKLSNKYIVDNWKWRLTISERDGMTFVIKNVICDWGGCDICEQKCRWWTTVTFIQKESGIYERRSCIPLVVISASSVIRSIAFTMMVGIETPRGGAVGGFRRLYSAVKVSRRATNMWSSTFLLAS